MIVRPKIRGFICTTAHPIGCAENVNQQITYVKSKGKLKNGPKKVLVIGASTGYGLASRINAAFSCEAATIGVFFEKPATENRLATAGWYNTAAFDKMAKEAGLYSKNINGDAFSDECRKTVIELIKKDLGSVDLVIYSLASPVRKMPNSGEVARSVLKPIGNAYTSVAIDTNRDKLFEATIEPATEQEIQDTVKVMGGGDWLLWMDALLDAGVLADNVKTVAYSYIGTELTWPIYWHGTLGRAKEDLERSAHSIDKKLSAKGGHAYIAVLKSVVTQASSAIPVMPLYIAMAFKVMKSLGLHEGCIEQIQRLFSTKLVIQGKPETDDNNRLRLDDWELRADVQAACRDIWSKVTDDNLYQLTDYQGYKEEFLRLFGFGIENVNYDEDVNPMVDIDVIDLSRLKVD